MRNIIFVALSVFSFQCLADELIYEGPSDWTTFEKFMEKRDDEDQTLGLSYMISGVAAAVGGVVGYYSSDDSLSRGLYAVTQSVGVAAAGYGATYYFIGNEYTSFYRAVQGAKLSPLQKSDLLRRFLDSEKRENERRTFIKIATHSLIALVNFYGASREEDRNVRGILTFLGAVNACMAITYAF